MTRLFMLFALLIWATPLLAQQLPPGTDPQNTILIDTKYCLLYTSDAADE